MYVPIESLKEVSIKESENIFKVIDYSKKKKYIADLTHLIFIKMFNFFYAFLF